MPQDRVEPKEGQESVWDYPRPPRLEPVTKHLKVIFNGVTIAETDKGFRVLETSHPPVFYFPPRDVKMEFLKQTGNTSFCEFKGRARYCSIKVGDKEETNSAWFYPQPTGLFAKIGNYIAFYPSRMDGCYIDEEIVTSQEGDFYGGWITKEIVGPFKGGSGTMDW